MPETTSSTLSRVANVLGVADKYASKGNTPFDNIIKMQHFTLWGFIVLVVVVGLIIWLVQKKLDSIDKQYKEQYILLHRLFKSHQDLQVKVHVGNKTQQQAPVVDAEESSSHAEPEASDSPVEDEPEASDSPVEDEPEASDSPVEDEPEAPEAPEEVGFRDSSSLVGADEDVDVDAY
jgi:uncharacterized membrane protein